jgi:AcrR family transcriptional regulator
MPQPGMKEETNRLPLRERNRQRVNQRILRSAFALFRAVGYNQTTLDAIAEKAEVSRGTLFNYFPTKNELLIPFMEELYLQQVQPEIIPYLDTQPTMLQALRFLFTSIYEHIFKLPDMDHALQALQQELYPLSRKKEINQRTGLLDDIQSILHYGQQRGEVGSDIPLKKLEHYIAALYLSLIAEMISQNISTRYIDEVDTLLAFIESALR